MKIEIEKREEEKEEKKKYFKDLKGVEVFSDGQGVWGTSTVSYGTQAVFHIKSEEEEIYMNSSGSWVGPEYKKYKIKKIILEEVE